MPISRASLARLSLLASLWLQLVVGFANPVDAAASVTVISSSARPDFPNSISFELSADIEGEVEVIDLVYLEASLPTYQLLPGDFEVAGGTVIAQAIADLASYYVPPGIDLTYHWVVTMADGEIIETESNTVTWKDDRFDWDLLTLEGIELYSYNRSDKFLEFASSVCEESTEQLSRLYGTPDFMPIRIWIYESTEDFAGTLAANSQEWIAGSAYPDLQVIQAVIPDNSQSEVRRVLPHEISHQLLYQATMNPFTATATWIDEGLAVLAQTGGKDLYRKAVQDAYEDGELLSLRGLISTFPFDSSDARKAYGQSFLIMEFVIDRYGPEAIDAVIAGYRAGLSHDAVLVQALGLDTDDLEAQWINSLGDQSEEQAA
jgi:hypothetical protein